MFQVYILNLLSLVGKVLGLFTAIITLCNYLTTPFRLNIRQVLCGDEMVRGVVALKRLMANGRNLGLEVKFWVSRLRFRPQNEVLGLEARIKDLRLELWLWGSDLSLKAGTVVWPSIQTFESQGRNLGFEARVWASWLKFQPQGRNLSPGTGIWACRLSFAPQGWDLSLERSKDGERRKKSPICAKARVIGRCSKHEKKITQLEFSAGRLNWRKWRLERRYTF